MASGRKTGGRLKGTPNKATGEIKELARSYAPAAMKELARLSVKAESEQARVSAIKELFDRGYGRAPQSHEVTGANGGPITTVDLTNATKEQIDAIEAVFGPLAVAGDDNGGGEGGEVPEGDS